ncbi:MAG: phage holin [Prevotella sp.]|nr:phage holin [Prevotella sp.]
MFSNNVYDKLKWICLIFLPALATFYSVVGKIWGLPYCTEIPATITALGVFLGALIGVSTRAYNKVMSPQNDELEELNDEIESEE